MSKQQTRLPNTPDFEKLVGQARDMAKQYNIDFKTALGIVNKNNAYGPAKQHEMSQQEDAPAAPEKKKKLNLSKKLTKPSVEKAVDNIKTNSSLTKKGKPDFDRYKHKVAEPSFGLPLNTKYDYKGCVTGMCADYEKANKMGKTQLRQMSNMYGNAWQIADSSFGDLIDFKPGDYSNIKVNDMVILSRGAFKSDKAKGIPAKNQHVGRVSRIINGVPYVKHYIGGSVNAYYEEPINKIQKYTKYTPSIVKRIDAFRELELGKSNFKFDEGYTPNRIEEEFVKGSRSRPEIQRVLALDGAEYDELERIAYGIIGAESSFGRSKRTLYRMAAPDFMQKIVKVAYDAARGVDNYDENINNLSQGYSSTKESTLHGVSNDNPEELKAVQRKVGADDDGVYGTITANKIAEWNKNNPDDQVSYKTVQQRVKDKEFKGLSRTNNYLYSALGKFGITPDTLDNGENSYKAIMSHLAWLKKRNPELDEEGLLKKYTGKKDVTNYRTGYDEYIKNIDADPANNMEHSLLDQGFGMLTTAANDINKNLKQAKSSIISTARDYSPLPITLTALLSDVAGGKEDITENSISSRNRNALGDVIVNAMIQGKSHTDYNTFFPELTREEKLALSGGTGGKAGFFEKLGKMTSPRGLMQNFLGQSSIRDLGNGEFEITDTYDFNDQGKGFSLQDDIIKRGAEPYALFRSIGRNYGSQDGVGTKVRIRIKLTPEQIARVEKETGKSVIKAPKPIINKLNILTMPTKTTEDVKMLQRELAAGGYKLPNSTRRDGTFDGVMGKETQDALNLYKQDTNQMSDGGVLRRNKLYRSFQGGGFLGVSGWDPLEADGYESLGDEAGSNSRINNMLSNLISYDKKGTAIVNPNITSSGRTVSRLERLFTTVEPDADFSKFFDFLAHTAEAESFSGDATSNKKSSASGDFHILTDNNKNGGTSSFGTGKQRIRNLKKKYGHLLSNDPEVMAALNNIIEAKSPADLSKEEQAMFVFVDLKMKSNNLKDFLAGKLAGSDLYSREWVTEGNKNHSKAGILTNWVNADKRRSSSIDRITDDEKYFGIQVQDIDAQPMSIKDDVGRIKFEQREKLKNLSPMYRSGGKVNNHILKSNKNLQNVRNRSKLF